MMRSVCLALLLLTQVGCAQYMAFTQKGRLDRRVLQPGSERMQIVGKLGAPKMTNEEPGPVLVDTYNYTDGGQRNRSGWRAARIVLYTAGDFFTLFLSQLLFMPSELLLKGSDYMAVVEYEPGAGETWVAGRITETKLSGKSEVTVQERPGFAEERAAALAAAKAAEEAASAAVLAAANPVANGTCFAVAPDGQLLTANHLVANADRIGVELADGRRFDATVERRDVAANAAVLRVAAPTPLHVTLAFASAVAAGQPVFTLGHGGPSPQPAELAEGAVDALASPDGDANYVRVAFPAENGDAGAPLLDDRGAVIGLVTKPSFPAVQPASNDAPAQPDGLWAVRSTQLTALIAGDVPALPPAASREEAIARARAAVCRVQPPATQEASMEPAATATAPTSEPAPQPEVEAEAQPAAP